MPADALIGFGHEKLTDISSPKPAIKTEDIVFIGLKDVDPPEEELIQKVKLNAFYIRDILANGLSPIFESINTLNEKVDHVWLSFDLDGVDADHAPGVGMPNKGGLTYREIYALIEHVGKNCNILGMDLVEYNPVNDVEHKTANLATEMVALAFGKEYSWYSEYLTTHSV